jgi:hypothetical protein
MTPALLATAPLAQPLPPSLSLSWLPSSPLFSSPVVVAFHVVSVATRNNKVKRKLEIRLSRKMVTMRQ